MGPVVVLGASSDESRYSHMAMVNLREHGWPRIPVHPREKVVDGVVQLDRRGVEQRPAGVVLVRQAEAPHDGAIEHAVLLAMRAIAEFVDQDAEQRRLRRAELPHHAQRRSRAMAFHDDAVEAEEHRAIVVVRVKMLAECPQRRTRHQIAEFGQGR